LEVFPLTPFLQNHDRMITFDVGANTGLWSKGFCKIQGPHVDHHVMFDPIQGNLDRFVRRDQNILSRLVPDTHIVGEAVGAEVGEVEIHFDKETTTLASISNAQADHEARVVDLQHTRTVPLTTIDAQMTARHPIGHSR
jgi:FkbM family methyltransferase